MSIEDCYDEITLACGRHQEATLQSFRTKVVYREGVFHRRAALEKALLYAVTPYEEF